MYSFIIDRKAGEIICWVASVRPSVCLSVPVCETYIVHHLDGVQYSVVSLSVCLSVC